MGGTDFKSPTALSDQKSSSGSQEICPLHSKAPEKEVAGGVGSGMWLKEGPSPCLQQLPWTSRIEQTSNRLTWMTSFNSLNKLTVCEPQFTHGTTRLRLLKKMTEPALTPGSYLSSWGPHKLACHPRFFLSLPCIPRSKHSSNHLPSLLYNLRAPFCLHNKFQIPSAG